MKRKRQPPPAHLYTKGDYLFSKIAGWEQGRVIRRAYWSELNIPVYIVQREDGETFSIAECFAAYLPPVLDCRPEVTV